MTAALPAFYDGVQLTSDFQPCRGVTMPHPKDKHLHENKTAQCCAGDRAKLGNQNIRGKSRETNVNDSDCDQPAAPDDQSILQKLPHVIATLASENPKLIEQKVASNPNEIGQRNRNKWRQKPAKEEDHRKVDQSHCTAYGAETNKPGNFLGIDHK
jgi:hypothetical protein